MLERSVEIDPQLAEGWAGLGLYYLQLPGAVDESIEYLRRSLALNPNQIDSNNWLQTALASRGKITEATRVLEQINDRDPLYGPAIFNLSVKYVLSNQLDKSLALIERSERYMGSDIAVDRAKGLHYLLSQQTVQGYRVAKRRMDKTPTDPGTRFVFGIAKMQLHDNEWVAENGLGWARCQSLSRLKRVEEGEQSVQIPRADLGDDDPAAVLEFEGFAHGHSSRGLKCCSGR